MPRRFLPFLVLPFLASCALLGDDGSEQSELERQRQQWQRQGYASYEYELNIGCFCPYFGPAVIRVQADTVAALDFKLPPDVPPPTEAERRRYALTVDDLFDVIEHALREADALEVTYHDTLGYPLSISIDYWKDAVDDEIGYTIHDLRPLR